MDAIHNRLARFLANLEHLDADGQHDSVIVEVQETFGRFDPPADGRGVWWELELHGITAEGATAEAAIAYWKKAAARALESERLGHASRLDDPQTWEVTYRRPGGRIVTRNVTVDAHIKLGALRVMAALGLPPEHRPGAHIISARCIFDPAAADAAGGSGPYPAPLRAVALVEHG